MCSSGMLINAWEKKLSQPKIKSLSNTFWKVLQRTFFLFMIHIILGQENQYMDETFQKPTAMVSSKTTKFSWRNEKVEKYEKSVDLWVI